MRADQLLDSLRELDVKLVVEGDRLRCSAPKGRLTPELESEIKRCKPELVRMLGEYSKIPPAKREEQGDPPLSFAQERLWFLDRLHPNNPTYNITAYRQFSNTIDTAALEFALHEIAQRHEILRTNFVEKNGEPVQSISETIIPKIAFLDLAGESEAVRQDRMKEAITAEAGRTFDLGRDLLFRVTIIRASPEYHLLLLTIHHIISDGWSIGVFFRELTAFYEQYTSGLPADLPALPIQYADFAWWERRRSGSDLLNSQLSYWKQKLADSVRLLELPVDHPRPATATFGGGLYQFEIDSETSQRIKRLARQEGVSLFMALLSVFKALLFRYTHQSDILVGSPVSTRNGLDLEPAIGFFVNTLVLRTTLPAESSTRDLLHLVKETVLEAHANQDVPFERLVRELGPERSLSHSPLFQVAFVLLNTPSYSEYDITSSGSMFDLTLNARETRSGICGSIEYSTDLFEQATMKRFATHFCELAKNMTMQPDEPIAQLDILPPAERFGLLQKWSGETLAYPGDACVHDLFEEQVSRTPDSIAVVCEARELTYRDLSARSNQLADRLRGLGIRTGSLVALCVDRSSEMLVGLLAILKAGAAYLPLDPQFPKQRLAFMLADSGAGVLVTEGSLEQIFDSVTLPIVRLDDDQMPIESVGLTQPATHASPEDLAYVLYTSGSTGKPKGVEISHRALVNLLISMKTQPGISREDRLLAVTTLSFDISGLEMFLPLIVGATVVIAPRPALADGAMLRRLLEQHGCTMMQATPVTWRLLLESGWQGKRGFKILCGGEAMARELANRLLAGGTELWNLYGPTETTIYSTRQCVEQGSGPVSIGKPIANTQIYVLDSYLKPVPTGVVGDLYIGGDGLARGYLGRPELTAEKFIPSPFRTGDRLYKTGDLARWLPQGNLDFIGRVDHQVKLRGYRIELGEIAAVMEQQPEVQQAVAIVDEDTGGDPRLIAYVVAREQMTLDTRALRDALHTKLPAYMVPGSFVELDVLPVTPNGKLDRKALPKPIAANREISPAGTKLEAQLLAIWERVLGTSGIGVSDNFFDLGGHSLLAVKLFNHLEPMFGAMPISMLFQAPTVRDMAAKLSGQGFVAPWRSLVAIRATGSKRPLFLVPGLGGNVICYAELARYLGPDQPIYALQSLGLDGKEEPLERIEDIAAHFIAEIRSVQAKGPYQFGGACMGGTVAFEMAQQLHAQGDQVCFLALLETWAPNSLDAGVLTGLGLDPLTSFGSRVFEHINRLWRLQWGERFAYVREKAKLLTNRSGNGNTSDRAERLRERVARANFHAMVNYVPKPYNGHIDIVLAEARQIQGRNDPRLVWAELAAGRCSIQRVGALDSGWLLKEPYVGMLAANLRERLHLVNS